MPGSGQSSQNQQQQTQQQTQSSPWGPTQGLLQQMLGQIGGQTGNTGPTQNENDAFAQLYKNAQGGNPWQGQIGDYATNLLNGGGAMDQAGNINSGYDAYAKSMQPWTSGDMANPATNPALQSMLDSIKNDTTNSVNGMFAAAGRDASGMNQQTLARGLAQGEAPVLLQAQDQANQARQNLYNAGNMRSGLLSGLNQQRLANMGQGVGASDSALNARNYGANQMLNISQQQRQLPLQNMQSILSMLLPIAGLGGQTSSSGSSSGQSQFNPSILQQVQGWTSAFKNMIPQSPGGGGGGGGGGKSGTP